MKKPGLLLLAVLTSISVKAVEPVVVDSLTTDTVTPTWINIGLGFSPDYPVAFNIGLNYQKDKSLLTVRFLVTDEMDLQNQSSSESVWDAGILFGRVLSGKRSKVSFAAGLSYVGGLRKGAFISNDETWGGYYLLKKRSSVGLPLEGHLVYLLSNNVGIGITAFGNLNLEKTFFGALLILQIGILR
jgi:hypothetical protein